VVVDTHVLAAAAAESRATLVGEERGPALELLERIRDRCPKIELSRTQSSKDGRRGEFPAAIQRMRIFLQGMPIFDELLEFGKLARSVAPPHPLTSAERKTLASRGRRRDVFDDEHLIETARASDGLIITRDETLLKLTRDLSKLGVDVIDVDEALRE
jgi:hypothetical protein